LGFFNGLMYLLCRQVVDTLCLGYQTTCIYQQAGSFTYDTDAVLPVTGNTGHVCYQGVTGTGQSIEDCGFSDIGPAYNGEYW
jgi:hypothetical protein